MSIFLLDNVIKFFLIFYFAQVIFKLNQNKKLTLFIKRMDPQKDKLLFLGLYSLKDRTILIFI